MADEPNSLHLTYEEAERVAADLSRVWVGMTGLCETPKVECIADVVQRALRGARTVIAERNAQKYDANGKMIIPEEELPY